MRVATNYQYQSVQTIINRLYQKQNVQIYQLASGKRFDKASENPIGANKVEIIKQTIAKIEQYQKNISDAKGMMETGVSALTNIYTVLEQIRSEILRALNGTNNTEDLNTLAVSVGKSIEHIVSFANTKHMGRYIFSGENILTQPFVYDGDTVIYNGNENDIKIEIAPGVEMIVGRNGDEYLTEMIQNLITAREQIKNNDKTGLETTYEKHLVMMNKVLENITENGKDLERLKNMNEAFIEQKNQLQTRRSETENIDYLEVVSNYTQTLTSLQASLRAMTMAFNTSILDYL